MIAKIWHRKIKAEHFEEYTDFMKSVAVPVYEKTEGFIKLIFLRRIEGEFAHFNLITFWKNLDVIKNFARDDYEVAMYYPRDKDYLLEFEEKVTHYDVFAD